MKTGTGLLRFRLATCVQFIPLCRNERATQARGGKDHLAAKCHRNARWLLTVKGLGFRRGLWRAMIIQGGDSCRFSLCRQFGLGSFLPRAILLWEGGVERLGAVVDEKV